MPDQGGEQSQYRLRPRATMTQRGPSPLMYPERKTSARLSSGVRTDAYALDIGLDDPRTNTSAIRYGQSTASQRLTGSSALASTQQPRRQQWNTKETPPRTNRTATITQQMPRKSRPVVPEKKSRSGVHWLLPVGIGMIAMLALWVLGSTVLAWGVQKYNDVQYGYPRTYHKDAVVGHNDSPAHPSHFVAVNLNRQVVVIEMMGGDPAKSVSYVAPLLLAGQDGDKAPVTLEFRDVTGDNKLDMIIHIHLQTKDQVSIFVNDGKKFRPQNSTDKIQQL